MSFHPAAETIETHACSIVLRRVEGPEAREIFFLCQPPAEAADAGRQAEAAYRAILGVLEAEGGSFASVVSETLFLRSLRGDLEPVHRVLAACDGATHGPATTEIEQPPLSEPACLEISVQAVLPKEPPLRVDTFEARPACGCAECARSRGLRVHVGEEARLYAAGLYGPGDDAYEQTLAIFDVAEDTASALASLQMK